MSRPRLIALLLALATLVVYLPVVRHDFVNCDDDVYVTDNPMVEQGLTWAGVKWAFTTYHGANWHPLTWLSHMADCEIFKLNPAGAHFVNVLFHAANTALLFILLWRLTGLIPPSVLVAALFAWHPLHVESVAWVAERKDVLSTFFALLTLLSYAKYAQQNCRRSLWFALIFYALGLLAKPMLVTLPFVLLLLDFWPLMRISNFQFPTSNFQTARQNSRSITALLPEKIPFFALMAISCVVTFIAQRNGHAVITVRTTSAPLPSRKCRRIGHALFAENALARRPRSPLSVRGAVEGRSDRSSRAVGGHFPHRLARAQPQPLLAHRLALVPRHPRASHWPRASRRGFHGRSLHLSSLHWHL